MDELHGYERSCMADSDRQSVAKWKRLAEKKTREVPKMLGFFYSSPVADSLLCQDGPLRYQRYEFYMKGARIS
ncbi:hypothetical protein LOC68_21865 [Blastopirellula sp. JC732]|uniref:Uncharacterized protein n=1 Tax=Blastopirellula sediminis TaxID=2894196 RepID=A0A9X1SIA0_9BACT|nr:hypothetical protein [Blastopirellula sediminis]MCC9605653.1 hypothetical protein [Blastopirellula sediminis]MCC9631047.1 hypothetical protein [Blastopirellula sediminis]